MDEPPTIVPHTLQVVIPQAIIDDAVNEAPNNEREEQLYQNFQRAMVLPPSE